MNPEFPHLTREELEVRLTALLLGELPPAEAGAMLQLVARDSELAQLLARLKQTIGLVRAAAQAPADATAAPAAPSQLAPERRVKLLNHFKLPTPEQLGIPPMPQKQKPFRWLAPALVCVAAVVVMATLTLPTLGGRKTKSLSETSRFMPWSLFQSLGERGEEQATSAANVAPALDNITSAITPLPGETSVEVAKQPGSQPPGIYLPPPAEPAASDDHFVAKDADAVFTSGGFGGGGDARGRSPTKLASSVAAEGKQAGVALGYEMSSRSGGEKPVAVVQATASSGGVLAVPADPAVNKPSAPAGTVAGTSTITLNGAALSDDAVNQPQSAAGYYSYNLNRSSGEAPADQLGRAQQDAELHAGLAGNKVAAAGETAWFGEAAVTTKKLAGDVSGGTLNFDDGAAITVFRRRYGMPATPATPSPARSPESTVKEKLGKVEVAQTLNFAGNRLNEAKLEPAAQPPSLTLQGITSATGTKRAVLRSAPVTGTTREDIGGVRYLLDANGSAPAKPPAVVASPVSDPVPALGDMPVAGRFFRRELSESVGVVESVKKQAEQELARLDQKVTNFVEVAPESLKPPPKSPANAPVPQPEIQTVENPFSTFSLNVADVSFKLAQASLEKGVMPDAASIRSEEFINAFDYRDPEPPPGAPIAFAWERARDPFAHNRDALRFSIKTAAAGRQGNRPLNLVLLLDNSGSMERADRVRIIREALRVLATQLQPQDKVSVVAFARTARLWVDALPGSQAGELVDRVGNLTPQGGTNLEDAMNLAYQTALRHYLAGGMNRVVLLTDGAANLGDVSPDSLKQKVEQHRKQGIAFDCFGIGWEGYNDDLLETLSRNGDGRYGFVNTPEAAATEFAGQLAGALQVAASDVKVQVEFNPARVTAYRQVGYAKHQLTKEQFRDNTVDAAEIAAAEAGNGLYLIETNPQGQGPIATVRVRYKVPGTSDYREQEWTVPYTGTALPLAQASPAMRLCVAAAAFSEWLASSPFSGEVTSDALLGLVGGVPEIYGADARPKKLEWMIRQAKSLSGR